MAFKYVIFSIFEEPTEIVWPKKNTLTRNFHLKVVVKRKQYKFVKFLIVNKSIIVSYHKIDRSMA